MLDIEKLISNVHEYVERAVAPLHARIKELEARGPVIVKGEDGKSVTAEDVAPMIAAEVAKAVSAIPPARDGKDADESAIAEKAVAAARQAAEDWCKANPPTDGKNVTVDDVAPLIAEQVQKAVEALPVAQDGRDGRDGVDGRDAEPLDGDAVADAVVAKLLDSSRLDTLADMKATAAVSEHLKANPIRDGKDGLDGRSVTPDQVAVAVRDYLQANPPAKGDPGRDGLDLKDLFRADGGHLVAVMSDGTTKDLGVFVGKDGEPGRDGADFSKCEIEYDGERTITIRGEGGEIRKHVDIPLDRGYWREGMDCEKSDIVTHDGNAWMALRDTKAKPCHENKEEWRLFARKGRDGRDGKDGKPPPGPVKLND